MARNSATIQDPLVTVSLVVMAKAMVSTASAAMARMAGTFRVASPVDPEVSSAWEAQVPLVLLHLALSKLRRCKAEGHHVLLVEPA